MKILAMGLIHKNNTDNQPIEYVYRTLIIFYTMKQLKFIISSVIILFFVTTYCDAQLILPFNVRNERITSLYLLSPEQLDSYNRILSDILKQWDVIKDTQCSGKSRRVAEEKLQSQFCMDVEAILSKKQFSLWKKNHEGNLITRFYKEDLGMTDEQFIQYRIISDIYANRKKEITRMNLIQSETADCRKEAFEQYSSSLYRTFSKELADYLIYENVVLNAAKTFSKTYSIIPENKAIKCAIVKVAYDKERKELEKQNEDRNLLRKKRRELNDKYERSLRQILTNEEYVACSKARDRLTDFKLKQTYNMSDEQLTTYKELKKKLAMKELVIKQRKEDRNKKEGKLQDVEKEFELELQTLFSSQQYERWQRDRQQQKNKNK